MNKYTAMIGIFLILASLSMPGYGATTPAEPEAGTKALTSADNPVILKNEILFERDGNNYSEVRHIALKGTNEQIGIALAEISQKDYAAEPGRYVDPIYAKARLQYMQKNYPAFYERMLGAAHAYNVSLEETDLDLSILPYDIGSPGCSVVFFPPSQTENGHAMACRNMDYVTVPFSTVLEKTAAPNEIGMFARAYVLELYPEEGYASLVIGGHDLMGTIFQGMNSAGLDVEILEDDSPPVAKTPVSGARNSGIPVSLAARMILDTCGSLEEAKLALLNNRIYFPISGQHLLIFDKYGNSTIAEFFAEDGSVHFTYGSDSIRIMTNHAVAKYPTTDTFPKFDANTSSHDTFLRYKTLDDMETSHEGKYSPQDMIDMMAAVYAEVNDDEIFQERAMVVTIPLRTTTNSLIDLTNGTISARFYLRDGSIDSKLGGPSPVFSPFFNFTLKKQ
ncbi:MAG TPA: C45 family autoproteolytic acyltransferase/hydrolase [Methanothrix sp.]|nr:C45 family autoproteolytic acyltransferase/hydrolase [Methanothrix sp.]